MKPNPRVGDGTAPANWQITNEIDKTRKRPPKNYVPFKERKTMGDPNPTPHLRLGKTKPKKVTLPKVTMPE